MARAVEVTEVVLGSSHSVTCHGGPRTEGLERFYAAGVAGVVQASVAKDPSQCWVRRDRSATLLPASLAPDTRLLVLS